MNEKRVTWPGWETVRTIGQGSFGTVYEIQRQVFDETEKAALKVISIPQNHGDIEEMYTDGYDEESITSTFQSHLKSIVAEYSMTKKMSGCVNIVSCEDVRYVQHDDGIGWDIFIKMELLTPLIKALPVQCDDEEVIRVGMDLCNALQTCRQYDLLHRDIKPQNIFVSDHGDYKLGDFGIAKTVEKTSGGTKIGTYKYMAPEVYNNQPYGAAADQYSLGLVLYWLLNERRMPFLPLPPEKLKSELDEQARKRRMSGEALPAPAHGCPELKKIVLKACAFEPGNRFASAQEMREALQALKQQIDKAKAPTCPSCGAALKPGAAFCTKCGASLTEKKEPAPENTCPSCGGALKPGATFCTKCGASLAEKKEPAPEKTCPSCGAVLKPGAAFCTKCGASLAEKKEPAPEKTCPSCGGALKPGAVFCTKCGASLAEKKEPAPENACPSCGAVLKPGAAFCTKCGASLAEKKEPAPEKTCPSCGGALKPGAMFCTKCGASLAEKKEPAPENACPSCGAALKPDTTFCTKCGAILAARVRKPEGDLCSSCGAVLKPGAAFCTKCGARR